MARTRNPHEAALKAWRTRHGGAAKPAPARDAGAVQAKGDWRKQKAPPAREGDWRFSHDPGEAGKLLKHPWGEPVSDLRKVPGMGDKHTEIERQMREVPAQKAKYLGGGVAGAYKVTLENGMEGNFKPQYNDHGQWRYGIEPGQNAEREAASWEVAKIVGMDDMVARAVIREVEVPSDAKDADWQKLHTTRGSFAEWVEGSVAQGVGESRRFGSLEEQQRVAVYDFVIGNQDRHHGNWVVQADGKVKMIDHGLTFGEEPRHERAGFHDQFAGKVLRQARDEQLAPPRRLGDFAKFAEPYILNKDRILSALAALKLPQRAIARAKHRLERLVVISQQPPEIDNAKKWEFLCREPE